jgi:hypothetical protein
MPLINNKYKNVLNFTVINSHVTQFCFKNKEITLVSNSSKYLLNDGDKYNWPFIDLFSFSNLPPNNEYINFFGRDWIKSNFFPINTVPFLDMNVAIPNNPNYFLEINYSKECTYMLVSSQYFHKNGRFINKKIKISLKKYLEYV